MRTKAKLLRMGRRMEAEGAEPELSELDSQSSDGWESTDSARF